MVEQELWLDNNQLTRLEGLEGMVTLRVLSACSNQLETLEGLEGLQLHELYVNDNKLTTLEPIRSLQALRVLQVGLTVNLTDSTRKAPWDSCGALRPCQAAATVWKIKELTQRSGAKRRFARPFSQAVSRASGRLFAASG